MTMRFGFESSPSSSTTISALLRLLLVAAIAYVPFVAAETTGEELYATIASASTASLPGFNVEGTSVLTNTLQRLSIRGSSFSLDLEHFFMKNLRRILCISLLSTGAATSPSLMSATAP